MGWEMLNANGRCDDGQRRRRNGRSRISLFSLLANILLKRTPRSWICLRSLLENRALYNIIFYHSERKRLGGSPPICLASKYDTKVSRIRLHSLPLVHVMCVPVSLCFLLILSLYLSHFLLILLHEGRNEPKTMFASCVCVGCVLVWGFDAEFHATPWRARTRRGQSVVQATKQKTPNWVCSFCCAKVERSIVKSCCAAFVGLRCTDASNALTAAAADDDEDEQGVFFDNLGEEKTKRKD